ncbi:27695_t:CDS:1, partial [Gigaspora margarita]
TTNIESSFNVIVPKLLPPSYKFSVAIYDFELEVASNCILFNR